MKSLEAVLFALAMVSYAIAAVMAIGSLFGRAGRGTRGWVEYLALIGLGLHTLCLACIVAECRNIPITNVSNTVISFVWCFAVTFIIVERAYKAPALGAFLLPALVVVGAAVWGLVGRSGELPAGLAKFWLIAHIVPIFSGYAAFGVGAAASALLLVQQRRLKTKAFGKLGARLPSLETLRSMSSKALLWGFPLLTIGLLLGVIWVKSSDALGPEWRTDWKVLSAVVTWVLYGALIHVRRVRAATERTLACLTVGAFILVIFTFLGTFMLGAKHAFKQVGPPNLHRGRGTE